MNSKEPLRPLVPNVALLEPSNLESSTFVSKPSRPITFLAASVLEALAMQVGVQLPEVEREVRWPEYRAMARTTEEVGLDSIWLGDHLLYRGDGREERGPWEAWTLLAALAAVTERVRLGPLVACASFHPPGLIAKMAATIDEMSGGRFILGLGAGWNQTEYRAFGLPYDHRVSRFAESFEIVRRLVAGERATLAGRFWQCEDAVLLPRPARRLPLMVGSAGERMLQITLPHVESWNCWYSWYGNTVEGFAALSARVSAAAEEVGCDPAAIARSACVLVELEPGAVTRPHADRDVRPVALRELPSHLRALGDAGAAEAILILRPIDEPSIRAVGDCLGHEAHV
jgi:alkanesulfonate monooxygenase SsuD/methylene tetrahydromethanopterin reductase-like flavin-dependent oxidoreductase (luciferase family)